MKNIEKIFIALSENDPNPKTELYYTNTFTLLLAVVLSARNTDKGVNQVTKKLFPTIQTPHDILELGENALRQHIKTIGLYKKKAKYIIELSRMLILQHKGEVPNSKECLEKLPGVGKKTASVILNIAFQKDIIAVDTHILRLSHRIGLSQKKTPYTVADDLNKKIPKKWKRNAHHWLINHGRHICKSRKPLCVQCTISKYCDYYLHNKN